LSKNVAVFVDVANLYYSARGQDVDVDYVALLKAATKSRDLIRAYAYSGLDPENENQRKFIDFLGKNGYKVVIKDIRKFGDGRVKANLDIELVVDLFRLADRMDIAVVVSGDGDFAPAIRALQDKGVRCEVISFRPNTSSDLLAVADEFIDIMKVAGIGREKKKTGMSAPAMPAKEVVPEFGFREASPQVAAAALAAVKGVPEKRRAQAATVARNGEGEAGDDADGGDTRSRRRRRGGRGRGRGRGREAVAAEAAADDAEGTPEITWTEIDDLSELDDLGGIPEAGEEREYTFSEVDPETLAELGLDAGDTSSAVPPTEATPDEASPRPRRRRRTGKETAEAKSAPESDVAAGGAAPSAEEEEEEAKPRRRTRRATRAKAETEEKPAGEETAEEPAPTKPRRRRSTKAADESESAKEREAATAEGEQKKPSRPRRRTGGAKAEKEAPREAAAAPEGDQGGQGIWERFRSARGGSRSS
jgi:uncharacterized LabA/DUF88 family protein